LPTGHRVAFGGSQDGLEQPVEVARHSAADVAITLHELSRSRNLAGQPVVPRRAPGNPAEPAADQSAPPLGPTPAPPHDPQPDAARRSARARDPRAGRTVANVPDTAPHTHGPDSRPTAPQPPAQSS